MRCQYQPSDAAGFIRLYGLSQRVAAIQKKEREEAGVRGPGSGVRNASDEKAATPDAALVEA